MKQRNGIWQSEFRLSNGERVRTSLGTKDKPEAARKERELQVTMEAALRGSPAVFQAPHNAPTTPSGRSFSGHPTLTLEAAFRRAMREYEPWRSSTSRTTIEGNYGHVEKHFGESRSMSSFTRPLMIEYVEKLRDSEGLSGSTINQRLSLVSVLLTLSEEWLEGAVSSFKMPRQKVRKGRVRVLSYDEEFKVLRYLKEAKRPRGRDEDFMDLVKFLVDTGFRPAEALRLRTSDVDWDNGLVPAWETKADLPRQVPMTKRVLAIMESRKHLEEPFGMFSVDSADDHWDIMRTGLCVDVARDPEFVLYALRHTCASRLAASGMDAFRIQKWMGHKNIVTTQKYVTLFGNDLHDLANALDVKRLEAAKKVPLGGSPGVPRLVPKGSSRRPTIKPVENPRRATIRGSRPTQAITDSVGVGLLIRRSLVRAQVGEPELLDTTDEVDTNRMLECDQGCDQK